MNNRFLLFIVILLAGCAGPTGGIYEEIVADSTTRVHRNIPETLIPGFTEPGESPEDASSVIFNHRLDRNMENGIGLSQVIAVGQPARNIAQSAKGTIAFRNLKHFEGTQ